MVFKLAQLVLFAIVPYLAVTFTTPDTPTGNDPVGAQEVVDADANVVADDSAERETL